MANLKTYDPAKVVLIVQGVQISGFAEDSFIEAGRMEDTFSAVVGADGKDVTRTKNNNRLGQIKFRLNQSSDSNLFLSALQILDENSGSGTFNCSLTDMNSASFYISNNCFFTRHADPNFGKNSGDREWTILLPEFELNTLGITAIT